MLGARRRTPPLTALSAPPGPNPGGDLVNAAPDDQSDLQQWELVVSLVPITSEFWVTPRNKHTGFVAAAPVGDNSGNPSDVWWVIADFDDPEGRH